LRAAKALGTESEPIELKRPPKGAANPNNAGFPPAVGGAPFGWKHWS